MGGVEAEGGWALSLALTYQIDMRLTYFYVFSMGIGAEIRNMKAARHRWLMSRAALAGMSLSDYLLSEIRPSAERPTLDDLRARMSGRSATALSISPADAIRAERDRL